jgi:uncharacterized protein
LFLFCVVFLANRAENAANWGPTYAMVQLGCNYSKPLLKLLAGGEVEVEWIKLSRDETLEAEVAVCRSIRPALVHTLRGAGMPPERFAAVDWDRLNRSIADSRSPHLAIHFEARNPDPDHSVDEVGERAMFHRMLEHIGEAKARIAVPLLVENVPWRSGHTMLRLCAEPANLRVAVEQTDTGLLLDTAHLRVAALNMGMDPREYARALPLERVREVHVAGPRQEEGIWRDRHMELLEEDYALIAWLLERTAPQMLTLEYGGTGPIFERPGMSEPEALLRQLRRLRGMLQ